MVYVNEEDSRKLFDLLLEAENKFNETLKDIAPVYVEPLIGQYYVDLWLTRDSALDFVPDAIKKTKDNPGKDVYLFEYKDGYVIFYEYNFLDLKKRFQKIIENIGFNLMMALLDPNHNRLDFKWMDV